MVADHGLSERKLKILHAIPSRTIWRPENR